MNRNESFESAPLHSLTVRLVWAPVEIISDDVEQMQVLIAGDESDVSDMKLVCRDGQLLVEQPARSLPYKLNAASWMQVLIRIPRLWKGALSASTVSGTIRCRGLSGSDLTLETVTGDLQALDLTCITAALRSVSGDVRASGLSGEKCSLRTVSGNACVDTSAFSLWRTNTVSGRMVVDMNSSFTRLEGSSVSGIIRLQTPANVIDASLRSVHGQLRTSGVAIQPEGPAVTIKSVSGDLDITCNSISEEE